MDSRSMCEPSDNVRWIDQKNPSLSFDRNPHTHLSCQHLNQRRGRDKAGVRTTARIRGIVITLLHRTYESVDGLFGHMCVDELQIEFPLKHHRRAAAVSESGVSPELPYSSM
jgi:hypothetical protein